MGRFFGALSLILSTGAVTTALRPDEPKPIVIEGQLREADAVIHGTYNRRRYKRLNTGKVVTEHELRLGSVAGIEQHDIIDRVHYKFYTPGGVWQGQTFGSEEVPEFRSGEEVVLLLKRTDHGYFVSNPALGTYRVKQKGRERQLVNGALPKGGRFSKIPFQEFDGYIEGRFGKGLYKIEKRYIYRGEPKSRHYAWRKKRSGGEKPGRAIASVYDKGAKTGNTHFLWLTLVLVALVFYCRRSAQRRK